MIVLSSLSEQDLSDYLPIPILTAIVISALMGATEFDLAARLWKVSRTEFLIFMGAFSVYFYLEQ